MCGVRSFELYSGQAAELQITVLPVVNSLEVAITVYDHNGDPHLRLAYWDLSDLQLWYEQSLMDEVPFPEEEDPAHR